VTEFRELGNRLAQQFRPHIEPAYEQNDWYPDQLVEDDGETWSLYLHGEHCLFTSLKSGTEVEVHTDCPDAIDPGFLLGYAESADRYPEIRAACLEGFHDMSRMLELAGIPLNPMELRDCWCTRTNGRVTWRADTSARPQKRMLPPDRLPFQGTGLRVGMSVLGRRPSIIA